MIASLGDGPGDEVKIRSAGIPVWVIVSVLLASGSVACAMIGERGVPSAMVNDGGDVIAGLLLGTAGAPAPSASSQSPGPAPEMVPHGSAGSPMTYVFAKLKPSQSVPNPVPKPDGLA